MHGKRKAISLGFEHSPVHEGDHICLIYRTEGERREVVANFLRSGLEVGEKVLSLVDTTTPHEFIEIMKSYDLDLSGRGEQLVIEQADPVYCPDGRFSSSSMVDLLIGVFRGAMADGYPSWRGTGEMSWALTKGRTSMDELIDYECLLNRTLDELPMTAFCQYDARRFPGAMLLDVLAVHPMMIVGGQLMKNPMYLDPDTFAEKYRTAKID